MAKAKKGDVQPIYQIVGWKVCKKDADTEDKEQWTTTEKYSDAELLSYVYKLSVT